MHGAAEVTLRRVQVVEDASRAVEDGTIPCVLGRDLSFDGKALGEFCRTDLTPRLDDLMVIAGGVRFADGVVRRPRPGWRRRIELVVPVRERDFWRSAPVRDVLADALRLATGDDWTLTFVPRRGRTEVHRQDGFAYPCEPTAVIPYSDGLDSFAAHLLARAREPHRALVLVRVGRGRGPASERRPGALGHARHRMVRVPFTVTHAKTGPSRRREHGGRHRPFCFGVVAGIAAHLLGANRVIVPESGQGSLGPELVPHLSEAADLRAHPLLTRRLEDLLYSVCGKAIRFEHPHLWETKGEVLTALRGAGYGPEAWTDTRSCWRQARSVKPGGRLLHCGACSACIFRRQSLAAAGVADGFEDYIWYDLRAASLDGAAPGSPPSTGRDRKYTKAAVLGMRDLARAGGEGDRSVPRAAHTLAGLQGLERAEAERRLRRLLAAHRAEWDAFVDALGPASFVARWATS